MLVNLSDDFTGQSFCIDRRSPLGNPFEMRDKHSDQERDLVIKAYKSYLWMLLTPKACYSPLEAAEIAAKDFGVPISSKWVKKDWKADQVLKFFRKICEYQEVPLACWCSPKACHGEVLEKARAWYLNQKDERAKNLACRLALV
jgi:hypothetical protein